MNKRTIIIVLCIILLFVALATITIKYDIDTNSNCVTSLSGLWSAVATFAVGFIAYRQAKKYKEISDTISDFSFMPEIYTSNSLLDLSKVATKSFFNKIQLHLENDQPCFMSDKIVFQIIRPPIIELSVNKIICNNTAYEYITTEKMTCSEKANFFEVQFPIPEQTSENLNCTIIMNYSNIYGTKYEKEVSFVLIGGNRKPTNIVLKQAKRIIA